MQESTFTEHELESVPSSSRSASSARQTIAALEAETVSPLETLSPGQLMVDGVSGDLNALDNSISHVDAYPVVDNKSAQVMTTETESGNRINAPKDEFEGKTKNEETSKLQESTTLTEAPIMASQAGSTEHLEKRVATLEKLLNEREETLKVLQHDHEETIRRISQSHEETIRSINHEREETNRQIVQDIASMVRQERAQN